jgi:hypothetical protein
VSIARQSLLSSECQRGHERENEHQNSANFMAVRGTEGRDRQAQHSLLGFLITCDTIRFGTGTAPGCRPHSYQTPHLLHCAKLGRTVVTVQPEGHHLVAAICWDTRCRLRLEPM